MKGFELEWTNPPGVTTGIIGWQSG